MEKKKMKWMKLEGKKNYPKITRYNNNINIKVPEIITRQRKIIKQKLKKIVENLILMIYLFERMFYF